MKHRNHVTYDYHLLNNEQSNIVVKPIEKMLRERGIKFSRKSSQQIYSKGRDVFLKFCKPIVGRDWKNSLITCTGIFISVSQGIGKDEARDENGNTVFENGAPKLVGNQYGQYVARFRFLGTERRYRRRNTEAIQDRTMTVFDYDDQLENIDFTRNINYLDFILNHGRAVC